jgi:hypothetical protein
MWRGGGEGVVEVADREIDRYVDGVLVVVERAQPVRGRARARRLAWSESRRLSHGKAAVVMAK